MHLHPLTAVFLALPGLLVAPAPAHGAGPPLRVCAEPANLPSSDRQAQGYENRIALEVAAELGRPIEFVWHPQWRAFVRKTLGAGRCDALVGVPAGLPGVLTTRPYYRSTYVYVTRAAAPPLAGYDDPRLQRGRVGVAAIATDASATPPGVVLGERPGVTLVGFSVYGERPAAQLATEALAAGRIDVAALWGPQAGYFARRAAQPLRVERLAPPPGHDGVAFDYAMAMAVRPGDTALQRALDNALQARRDAIDAILRQFDVPRVDAP